MTGDQCEGGEGPPHSPVSAPACPSPEHLPSTAVQLPGPRLRGNPGARSRRSSASGRQRCRYFLLRGEALVCVLTAKGITTPSWPGKRAEPRAWNLGRRILRDEHRPGRAQVRQAPQPSPRPQPSLSTPTLSPSSPHTCALLPPQTPFLSLAFALEVFGLRAVVPFWPHRALALRPAGASGPRQLELGGEALCHLAKGRRKRLTHHSGE